MADINKIYEMVGEEAFKPAAMTPEELAEFYHGMVRHVRECVESGWSVKDSVDYDNLLNQIDE